MRKRLVDFMKWYKNNVPIGTQDNSDKIVNDYLKSNNQAPEKMQIISENEALKKECCNCKHGYKDNLEMPCRECDIGFSEFEQSC